MTEPPTSLIDALADSRLAAERAAKERTPYFRAEMSQKAGGMYTRMEVANILGIRPADIDECLQRKQLLGVFHGTEIRYPAAQFKGGRVVAGLAPILQAFGDMNPWGQLQLLLAPIDDESERSIFGLLADGIDELMHKKLIALVRDWSD